MSLTAVGGELSESEASALWADLRSALVHFDQTLARIIETRAWEPLGYQTFAQAWADRMRGTRLGTASMAAHVVYALIESGMGREDALLVLGPASGVGPAKFDTLARQYEAGVPVEIATTSAVRGSSLVRQHYRDAPGEPSTVHVPLTPSEYAHFKALADGRGLDLATEGAKALRAHFRSLERVAAES